MSARARPDRASPDRATSAGAAPAGAPGDPELPPIAGLDVERFLARDWQRRPRLFRAALPAEILSALFPQRDLFALAADPDVESRLVRAPASAPAATVGRRRAETGWRLDQGPFRRLPPRNRPGWTVLIQGVDLHREAGRQLMDRFRFVPDARLDDLMISHASDGGGVGPHIDSYDVFLLQARGRRQWRVAPPQRRRAPHLMPGVPLKILADFEPTQCWVLEPGDMLYLPPGWGHEGTALGECTTCSIGFRAPSPPELRQAFFAALADADDQAPAGPARRSEEPRYRDDAASLAAATGDRPARIPDDMAATLAHWLRSWRPDARTLDDFIGRHLSEPKPNVWFDPPDPEGSRRRDGGVELDRRTRMLYRGDAVYVNGEVLRPPRVAREVLRTLADRRSLDAVRMLKARRDPWLRATLDGWHDAGWIRDADD